MSHPKPERVRRSLRAGLIGLLLLAGCVRTPLLGLAVVPPIPPGEARLWVYRTYVPSETLNMTKVTLNGAYAGYAQLGGAFYRNLPPGVYHVEVASYGRDFDQSSNVALVAGQQAYIKIESLRSWATTYGFGFTAGRDTFYARLMLPQIAQAEIARSFFYGGG